MNEDIDKDFSSHTPMMQQYYINTTTQWFLMILFIEKNYRIQLAYLSGSLPLQKVVYRIFMHQSLD